MAHVAGQILETAFVPVTVVALAGTGIWTVRTGLIIALAVLVVTDVAASLWAIRRSRLGLGRRLLIVAGELALCLAVIGIKLIGH
jgi:hypothetical protein